MPKKYKKVLFIFRRDLRLCDNTGLIKTYQEAESVIPCFIFDPRQIVQHDYRSDNAIQFMIESLDDLNEQLKEHNAKLYRFYGNPTDIIKVLLKKTQIEAVYVNQDYTPFSKKRDLEIEQTCKENNLDFHQSHDLLLNPPETITKKDGKPYTVFTPFFKHTIKWIVKPTNTSKAANFFTDQIDSIIKNIPKELTWNPSKKLSILGGREAGLLIIHNIKKYKNYDKIRDIPSQETTNLSAHIKFGTVSIREVYHALVKNFGQQHSLVRQLYWRDFYTTIAWWFPHVFGNAFKQQYNAIPWSHDKKNFKHWCDGSTGFPIIDAGMRELNETGFMHNRVRMITGSFLTKDLGIDWRWGEKYFATKLVDYDPAVNNGNWQWVASTGCDAQPYFRIFNPWLQQKKFDPDAIYIKKWVKELETIPSKEIHALWKKSINGYHQPMVNHQEASSTIKNWFKKGSL